MGIERMKDRLPPHSVEAERGLLGCVLLDPMDGVSKCRDAFPDADDFLYDTRHQLLFATVELVLTTENDVDLSKIVVALERSGKLETVGGYAYLSSLMDSVPSAANLSYYLATVAETYQLRRFIRVGTDIVQRAYEATRAQEVSDHAEGAILALCRGDSAQDRGVYDGTRLASSALQSAQDRYDAAHDAKTSITTGFAGLDADLRMRAGNLVVLAARPSVGKTSFALNIALHLAQKRVPVGILTLEMSPEEIGEQLTCILGGVDSKALDGGMESDDFERFGNAAAQLTGLPIFVEEGWGCNVWRVKQRIRMLKQKHGIKLAILDYLQLVEGIGRRESSRVEEVGMVSRGLKAVAKELQIPVMALCQLNRDIEKGAARAPRLSDLRESGSIEQDADAVVFLYHPEDTPAADSPTVVALVAKQRRGPSLGKYPFTFVKRYTQFVEQTVSP